MDDLPQPKLELRLATWSAAFAVFFEKLPETIRQFRLLLREWKK